MSFAFGNVALDRCSFERKNDTTLSRLYERGDSAATLLIFHQLKPLLSLSPNSSKDTSSAASVAFCPPSVFHAVTGLSLAKADAILLGLTPSSTSSFSSSASASESSSSSSSSSSSVPTLPTTLTTTTDPKTNEDDNGQNGVAVFAVACDDVSLAEQMKAKLLDYYNAAPSSPLAASSSDTSTPTTAAVSPSPTSTSTVAASTSARSLQFVDVRTALGFLLAAPPSSSTPASVTAPYLDLHARGDGGVSLIGLARSLLEWQINSQFCARCGSTTRSIEGGTKRKCRQDRLYTALSTATTTTAASITTPSTTPAAPSTVATTAAAAPSTTSTATAATESTRTKAVSVAPQCGQTIYPRIDPVQITLVCSPTSDRVLLGRKKMFPTHLYTCIAGFMEHGERVEDAVEREVMEETNVRIRKDTVRYVASQSWPFLGGQLMIGSLCVAEKEDASCLRMNDEELEDARWFHADAVRQALKQAGVATWNTASTSSEKAAGEAWELRVPPSLALANHLIAVWLKQLDERNSNLASSL